MSQQNILTGAGCKVVVNGVVIGFATSLNWTRSAGMKTIYEIDSNLIVDQIETTYAVTGNMSGFRIRNSGNLESSNVVGLDKIKKLFKRNFVTLEVIDRASGNTVAYINNVMFDNDSWNVSAKSQITFNVQFKGQFVSSEKS